MKRIASLIVSLALVSVACGGADEANEGASTPRKSTGKGGNSGSGNSAGSDAAGNGSGGDDAGGAAGKGSNGSGASGGAAGSGGKLSDTEACGNGIDDDGNGAVDDGCKCKPGTTQACYLGNPKQAGIGACKMGQQKCIGSVTAEFDSTQWEPCTGYGAPTKDICGDNVDNDCEGTADNGCECASDKSCSTACGSGIIPCVNGKVGECSAPLPGVEVCDGVDNDCDGDVDEGLLQLCTTACGAGIQACLGGVLTPCSAPEPTAEVCNDGVDNDCDGDVDEGCGCADGSTQDCSTVCGKGKQTCTAGKWGACSGPQPSAEICDGKDNDCDGDVDEGLLDVCSTVCGPGVKFCIDGSYTECSSAPVPEVCNNGIDDDCDGDIDEGCNTCNNTVCGGVCCDSKQPCCDDGSCADPVLGCPTPCNGLECNGLCCEGATKCCKDGCPDANGNCECSGGVTAVVVLDRSMSMRTRPDQTKITSTSQMNESRWAKAALAVESMINKSPSYVRWGLVLFPRYFPPDPANNLGCATLPDSIINGYTKTNDPLVCSQGEFTVFPTSDGSSTQQVLDEISIDQTYLCDQTATSLALEEAAAAKPDYVILVTDGEYECNQDPTIQVQNLTSLGAKTFVVGFDGSTTALGVKGRASLNECACVGGVPANPSACDGTSYDPASGKNSFYFANDPNGDSLKPILDGLVDKLVCN